MGWSTRMGSPVSVPRSQEAQSRAPEAKFLNLIREDKLCSKAAETAVRTNVLAVKL